MSFDEIFDLTAGLYFIFHNIYKIYVYMTSDNPWIDKKFFHRVGLSMEFSNLEFPG